MMAAETAVTAPGTSSLMTGTISGNSVTFKTGAVQMYVCKCVCVCVHAYVCVCMCVRICVSVYVCAHMCKCVCACIHVCVCVYMHASVYVRSCAWCVMSRRPFVDVSIIICRLGALEEATCEPTDSRLTAEKLDLPNVIY